MAITIRITSGGGCAPSSTTPTAIVFGKPNLQTEPAAPHALPTTPPGDSKICWEDATCAVCGESAATFVIEVKRLIYDRPGSARIVRCRRCGHLYQSPRPTRETIGVCYPADYGPHAAAPVASRSTGDSAAPQTNRPWYLSRSVRGVPGLRRFYHWLSDRSGSPLPVPPRAGASALELGCGAGGYLDRLREAGWQVEGVEPADAPAARCRARGLSVRTGGVETAVLDPESFDLVVAWMVIEHLHDPAAALRQIRTWLRPGGTLMISVPIVKRWEVATFGSVHYILNEPTHLQHFSRSGIESVLRDNGFRIDSLRYQENLYNHIGAIGIWMRHRFSGRRLGARLLSFLDDPSMWGRLALAIPAKLMAALGQTGRATIVASKSMTDMPIRKGRCEP